MKSSQRRRLARIFNGLILAEQISRDVSDRQAAMAKDPRMRGFLMLQSRQEAVHAGVFRAALRLTACSDPCPDPLARALARFATRLNDDLDGGWLTGSLIGLQGVLEAIGSVALRAPRGTLASVGARLVPFRGLLLKQEEAHHRYGEYWLRRLLIETDADAGSRAALSRSCVAYVDLGEEVLAAGVDVFEDLEVDRHDYLAAGRREIRAVHDRCVVGSAGLSGCSLPRQEDRTLRESSS